MQTVAERVELGRDEAVSARNRVVMVALATFVARMITRASFPTDWDSANLTIGVDVFDVADDAPHAPGYWLYVKAGWLIDRLTPLGPHAALVIVAAAASAATAAVAYVVLRRVTSDRVALVTVGVLASSPIAWFYGSMAATYSFDSLASVALVYIAVRARPSGPHLTAAVVVVALAAGFRPSIAVLYSPALLLIAVRSVRRPADLVRPVVAGVLTVLAWLVPMILDQPGGFSVWFDRTEELWRGAADATSSLRGADAAANNRHAAIANTFLVMSPALGGLAVAILGRIVARSRRRSDQGERSAEGEGGARARRLVDGRTMADERAVAYLAILAIAGSTAFVSVFVHFPKGGYLLSYSSVLFVGVGLVVGGSAGVVHKMALGALVLGAVAQSVLFLATDALMPQRLADHLPEYLTTGRIGGPYPYTWQEIRRIDEDGRAFEALAEMIDPERDVVVLAADNGGFRYRLASSIIRDVPVYYVFTLSTDFPQVAWVSIGGRLRGAEGWGMSGREIVMPPNGRAFVVLDVPTGQILDRERFGTATSLPLAPPPPTLEFTTPTIWVLDPTGDPLELWR